MALAGPRWPSARRSSILGRLAVLVVMALLLVRWYVGARPLQHKAPEDQKQTQDVPERKAIGRFLKPKRINVMKTGSLYQNGYMTLWSATRVPISVTLQIRKGNTFEMRVENLNSADGNSTGWVSMRGTFRLEAMPEDKRYSKLVVDTGDRSFDYDPSLFDGSVSIALKVLSQLRGTRLLEAVTLKLDMEKDAVLVVPRMQIIRMLWAEPAVLRLISKDKMWQAKTSR